MKQNKNESMEGNISEKRDFEDEIQDRYDKQYPCYPSYRSPKDKKRLKIIILILLIPLIIISIIVAGLCLISGGWTLEEFYFTFDSEAELDDALLNELYYNLDVDSRMNVTNETYFLVLSIPDLDYSIRFDYLFEFTNDNLTDLRIEHPNVIRKITSFETRDFYNPYSLSIEFQINSTDPGYIKCNDFSAR